MEPIYKHKKKEYKRDPSEEIIERKGLVPPKRPIVEEKATQDSSGSASPSDGPGFKVNLQEAKHATPMMREVIRLNKWKETTKRGGMHYLWHTTDDDILMQALQKGKIVNRYPQVVKPIARKECFENMMRLASDQAPGEYDFIPRSFIFPQDEVAFT